MGFTFRYLMLLQRCASQCFRAPTTSRLSCPRRCVGASPTILCHGCSRRQPTPLRKEVLRRKVARRHCKSRLPSKRKSTFLTCTFAEGLRFWPTTAALGSTSGQAQRLCLRPKHYLGRSSRASTYRRRSAANYELR